MPPHPLNMMDASCCFVKSPCLTMLTLIIIFLHDGFGQLPPFFALIKFVKLILCDQFADPLIQFIRCHIVLFSYSETSTLLKRITVKANKKRHQQQQINNSVVGVRIFVCYVSIIYSIFIVICLISVLFQHRIIIIAICFSLFFCAIPAYYYNCATYNSRNYDRCHINAYHVPTSLYNVFRLFKGYL